MHYTSYSLLSVQSYMRWLVPSWSFQSRVHCLLIQSACYQNRQGLRQRWRSIKCYGLLAHDNGFVLLPLACVVNFATSASTTRLSRHDRLLFRCCQGRIKQAKLKRKPGWEAETLQTRIANHKTIGWKWYCSCTETQIKVILHFGGLATMKKRHQGIFTL